MEFGRGSFVEMALVFLFIYLLFIVNGELIKYSMPGPNQHIFLFYAP